MSTEWATDSIDFQAVCRMVDVESVLHRYRVEHHRTFRGYRGTCPLCESSSRMPFSINSDTTKWLCFHCGKRGDAIDLVVALEGVSIKEAAEQLVDGRVVPVINSGMREARLTMNGVKNWREWRKKQSALKETDVPSTIPLLPGYRAVSQQAIDHFGLRRVPGSRGAWGVGVFLPLHNEQGELVGYAIRQDRDPKYLNSEGLRKASLLYGLWQNKNYIRELDEAILVEGQFDCISMWDGGHKNTVAIMGCKLSSKQATMLMAYTRRLTLWLDGDKEGKAGAEEIKKMWGTAFEIRVVELPEGTDPDSIMRNKKGEL